MAVEADDLRQRLGPLPLPGALVGHLARSEIGRGDGTTLRNPRPRSSTTEACSKTRRCSARSGDNTGPMGFSACSNAGSKGSTSTSVMSVVTSAEIDLHVSSFRNASSSE